MINGIMPIFILMMVMGMMSSMVGSGSHSSNPGNPDGVTKLRNILTKEIEEEKQASESYKRYARIASGLDMKVLERKLLSIAKDEERHAGELAGMVRSLSIAEEAVKEIGITPSIPPKYVVITDPGNTIFSVGDVISYGAFTKENDRVRLIGGRPAEGKASSGR